MYNLQKLQRKSDETILWYVYGLFSILEKKKKMQEALNKSFDEKEQTISPTSVVSVSPLLSPQFSSSQCNSSGLPNNYDFYNPQNLSQNSSVMNSSSFPVPYSKWIIVNHAYPVNCVDTVQTAKLVYYSPCKRGYSVNSISTKKEMTIKDMSASCPNTAQNI